MPNDVSEGKALKVDRSTSRARLLPHVFSSFSDIPPFYCMRYLLLEGTNLMSFYSYNLRKRLKWHNLIVDNKVGKVKNEVAFFEDSLN